MFPETVNGNLFDSQEQYICHQCNAITAKAAHLAYSMFKRFPWADVYSPRLSYKIVPKIGEMPGNIIIKGNGDSHRYVIALIGQYYPGKPKFPHSTKDGTQARETAFQRCLDEIRLIPDLKSLAFPWGIGCGAAGGDWTVYKKMIEDLASKMDDVLVRIYKK